MFCEFSRYKVFCVFDLIGFFSDLSIMRRLLIERTQCFEYQFYWRLFVVWSPIIAIIPSLVVCDLKILCKCSMFRRAVDVTG